ncbi:MAG TPA: hypothetical protein VFA21_05440 [Pyrinomonadaceae bacterium]|nr:hypothetical protein [Pyrinomonadaceae bacterium]
MKKQSLRIVASLALFVLAACVSASAQTTATRMKASVPFDFQIGQQKFAAGDYYVERVGRQTTQESLRISNADGTQSVLVRTSPRYAVGGGEEQTGLVFYRYGDISFLRQVRGVESDLSLDLQKSHAEGMLERELKVASNAKAEGSMAASAERQTVTISLRRR